MKRCAQVKGRNLYFVQPIKDRMARVDSP